MTLRWIEGFETDRTVSKLANKYQPILNHMPASWNAGSADEMSGRFHGTAIKNCILRTPPLLATAAATWTVGMNIRVFNLAGMSGDTLILLLYKGDRNQVSIQISKLGNNYILRAYRGSTLLGSTSTVFYENTWYYLEVQINVQTGTLGSVNIRMDETVALTLTGVNTANSGAGHADIVEFRCDNHIWIDDIYVLDSAGTVNNNYLGIQTVEGLRPNSDGTPQQWDKSDPADAYSLVDDPANVDESPDQYVYTNVSGEKEYFNLTNISQLGGDISGIQINGRARLDQAGTRDLRYLYKPQGGTENTMDWKEVGHRGETVSTYPHVEEQNPATSVDWTAADIDNGQFGVERQ